MSLYSALSLVFVVVDIVVIVVVVDRLRRRRSTIAIELYECMLIIYSLLLYFVIGAKIKLEDR